MNCPLKEDQNANIQATEENLEEINLNDTANTSEASQSLTADIAQNFSQLPHVLPQVASAVFSSFSSMLSLKTREQTPDSDSSKVGAPNSSGFKEVQFESPQEIPPHSVSFHTSDAPQNSVAMPPKEPPRSTSKYHFCYFEFFYKYCFTYFSLLVYVNSKKGQIKRILFQYVCFNEIKIR